LKKSGKALRRRKVPMDGESEFEERRRELGRKVVAGGEKKIVRRCGAGNLTGGDGSSDII